MRVPRVKLHVMLAIMIAIAPRLGVAAQDVPVGNGIASSLSGEVIHDETAAPLQGATVILAVAGPGMLTADPHSSGPFLGQSRSTITDVDGRYRFDNVSAGSYVLRVFRLGFRPATVELELRGAESRLSLGLAVVPVRLQPVAVVSEHTEPFARHARTADSEGAARVAALRQRQRRYLATDVREVTNSDVSEGITLGETDLFRALQRLPGVSSRSEVSAELWTRGARWDRTRVLFDGMPLFNPVHAAGVFSAVDPNAIGAAFLHPGVRPASIGEGGAGVLDLHSRSGGGSGELRGVGELSMVSARGALDKRSRDGRSAWMIAARRTYLDLLLPLFMGNSPEGNIPYHFTEIAGQYDRDLGEGRTLEVSGLHAQDHLTGDVADVAHGNRARWGNDIARITLEAPFLPTWLGPTIARHTLGASRYVGDVTRHPPSPSVDEYNESYDLPMSSGVTWLMLGSELAPVVADGAALPWTAGYELTHQRVAITAAMRASYVGDVIDTTPSSRSGGVTNLALWAERRVRPVSRLTVAPGLRVELGTRQLGARSVRISPRFAARFAPGDSALLFSAAFGRSYQYIQALDGLSTVANAAPGFVPLWLIADADTPPLRTDLLTVGVERWLGAQWHASANGYARRSGGVLVPDPRPGAVTEHELFVEGRESAHGVETSLRRMQGRWTIAFGYAYGVARMDAAGERYAPPEDRRHVFDATTMARVRSGLRVGAAYTSSSGTPYTRRMRGMLSDTGSNGTVWDPPPTFEAAGGERFAPSRSLDLLLDWSGAMRRTRIGMFLQLHNVLGHENPIAYDGPERCYDPDNCTPTDVIEHGLPLVPIFGFRLTF